MKKTILIIIGLLLLATTYKLEVFKASWYGYHHHGKRMANGKIFNKNKFTCAANSNYNLGDILDVTNIENGKCVTVIVTDRGSFFKYGRTLDLSEAAFREIADLKTGVIKIKIQKLN